MENCNCHYCRVARGEHKNGCAGCLLVVASFAITIKLLHWVFCS